jgi:hypothetical protein
LAAKELHFYLYEGEYSHRIANENEVLLATGLLIKGYIISEPNFQGPTIIGYASGATYKYIGEGIVHKA